MRIRTSQKFSELLLYLIAKAGNIGVVETKLMKLLYFSDAEYFNRRKKSISGVDYFRNHFGPTPDMRVITRAYQELSDVVAKEERTHNGKKMTVVRVKSKDFSYKVLTEEEMEVANEICKIYSNLSAVQLSDLSHLDPPYLAAKPKGKIDFKFVLYRKHTELDVEESANEEDQRQVAADISDDSLARLFEHVRAES